jgi:hypothetical protein
LDFIAATIAFCLRCLANAFSMAGLGLLAWGACGWAAAHGLAAWTTAATSAAGLNHRPGQEGVQVGLWMVVTQAKPILRESRPIQEPTEGNHKHCPRLLFFVFEGAVSLLAFGSHQPKKKYQKKSHPLAHKTP